MPKVKKKAARSKTKVAKSTMAKTPVAKKKVAKKKGRRPAPSPLTILAMEPVNKMHDAALKLVARTYKAAENASGKVVMAEKKLLEAKDKLAAALQTAAKKETAAAHRAVENGREAVRRARSLLAEARVFAVEAEKAVKSAVGTAETERKKEADKLLAIEKFVAKWEREYDRKAARRQGLLHVDVAVARGKRRSGPRQRRLQ